MIIFPLEAVLEMDQRGDILEKGIIRKGWEQGGVLRNHFRDPCGKVMGVWANTGPRRRR